ncbi:hypothetical protein EMCRGX_G017502 [Ephydatia muelleri]
MRHHGSSKSCLMCSYIVSVSRAVNCLLDGGHYQLQQHGAETSMDALGYLYKCTAGTKNAIIKVTNCIKLFYCTKLFEGMVGSLGEAILNDIDCPLLTLTKQLLPLHVLFPFVTSAAPPAP